MLAVEMLDHIEGHHRLEHRHFHHRPLATLPRAPGKRRRDRQRRHQPAGLVRRNGREVAHRAGLRGHQRGIAGQALDDVVVRGAPAIGALLRKAQQAHVDQLRMPRHHAGGVQVELGQLLRPHAVHEHVSRGQQPVQRGLRGRQLQVQHHALLAAVYAQEDGRHAVFGGGAGATRGIPLGRLHLDDLGAQVGQPLAGVRAHHDRGQVYHANARQRQHGRLLISFGFERRGYRRRYLSV
ncbi:hypothetical protein D3C81_1042770 [compost metagenome]